MVRVSSYITFTDPAGKLYLEFNSVHNVEIDKSRRTLTNTATVTLARNISVLNGNINDVIKRGSTVEIWFGYDDNLVKEFAGYVTSVGAKTPVEIECQDKMWLLKQNSFTHAWKKVKVSEIVKYVYGGIAEVIDLELGGFVLKQESTAQAFEKLRSAGLQCYFDNETLIVDFAGAIHRTDKTVIYDFNKNVVDNDLEYKRKEDSRIKVIGISKSQKGGKIEIVAGDPDGEVHTLHYTNMDKLQLQKIVNAEIEKLKYNGYKGDLTAFGLPYIQPGYTAIILDPLYPERDGSYLTESVKTTFGMEGFRRKITPERKLA